MGRAYSLNDSITVKRVAEQSVFIALVLAATTWHVAGAIVLVQLCEVTPCLGHYSSQLIL